MESILGGVMYYKKKYIRKMNVLEGWNYLQSGPLPKCIRRLPSYKHISKLNLWKIITPPFQFDHLPTQVPKPSYHFKDSESAIIFAHFFGGLAPTDPFV